VGLLATRTKNEINDILAMLESQDLVLDRICDIHFAVEDINLEDDEYDSIRRLSEKLEMAWKHLRLCAVELTEALQIDEVIENVGNEISLGTMARESRV
jgi:hypothetical protein